MRGCMGGWCALRDGCANYQFTIDAHPAERLCFSGRDGITGEDGFPIRIVVGSPRVDNSFGAIVDWARTDNRRTTGA